MATKEELLERLKEVMILNEYSQWEIDIYMDAGTYCTEDVIEEYLAYEEECYEYSKYLEEKAVYGEWVLPEGCSATDASRCSVTPYCSVCNAPAPDCYDAAIEYLQICPSCGAFMKQRTYRKISGEWQCFYNYDYL